MISACMGKKIFRREAVDIFRVVQIQGPHSALEAGFQKLKSSERTDFDEARGRKRDRQGGGVIFLCCCRGWGVDQVSFVSYFKGIVSFHLATSENGEEGDRKSHSHFRPRRENLCC